MGCSTANQKLITLCLILIFLVIAGCRGGTGVGRGRTDKPERVEFRTGTRGLTLNFPVGTLTEIFENDKDVRMIVEVRNEGAFPQAEDKGRLNGHIWVGGFDTDIIDLRPETYLLSDEALEGKSVYNLRGGYSAVVLSGEVFSLPRGAQSYIPKVIVTATYNYETIAAPVVCIDPEPRSTDVREKVCSISNYRNVALTGSQGAPVAVTSVQEDAAADNILFKIFIKNVGNGQIIDPDDVDNNPNEGYDWDRLNRVRIADVSVGNRRVTDCRPSIGDWIQLLQNEGFIFCRFSTAGIDTVYTSPLNIRLEYAYSNSIEREIKIFQEVVFR